MADFDNNSVNNNEKENKGGGYSSYGEYLAANGSNGGKPAPKNCDSNGNNGDDNSSSNGEDGIGSTGIDMGMVTPDEQSQYNGGQDDVIRTGSVLTRDTPDAGASGFSDVHESVKSRAGGLLNGMKNGISGLVQGTLGNAISSIKGMFHKGKGSVSDFASRTGLPARAVVMLLSVMCGGSVATIAAFFLNDRGDVLKYVDEPNCDDNSMISDYKAVHGAGDTWTDDSARSSGKTIYTALKSNEPWTFDTREFNGSVWQDAQVTNEGFGFSDEVIAGMLSNAYAESSIRPDCYEMDYLIHDVHDGVHFIEDQDLILGRTHHANWDDYVKRMFEIYAADGVSINESAYNWSSDDVVSSLSATVSDPQLLEGMAASVAPGLSGKYPGIGLWQWTGQRAYNMSRFANLQPDLSDGDQDGVNDVLYSTDLQLGFLYYENYGDFSEYGVSSPGVLAWGRQNRFTYAGLPGNDHGKAYKTTSFASSDTEYVGTKKTIDNSQDVFTGQQSPAVDTDRDTWDPVNGDETTIRWPKFIIKCEADGSVVGRGDGGTDEFVPDSYLSDSWSQGTLSHYITDSDNRVKRRFPCSFEYDGASLNYEIVFEDLQKTDPATGEKKKDHGYWSSTANSVLSGGVANYENKWQSNQAGNPGDSDTRKGTDIRVGREFNDNELQMLRDCYSISVTWGQTSTGSWYREVELTCDKDKLREVHDKLSDPDGKYIAADMRISAGMESAVECARQFAIKWEGISSTNETLIRSHINRAGLFYMLMQTDGWQKDETYAHSILEMVNKNQTANEIRDMYLTYVNKGCDPVLQVPDGIAALAVSWAWPKGTDNLYDINNTSLMDGAGDAYKLTKCTSLYCAVKDAMCPNDPFYSSCDRGVMTAVRASGADDDFVPGNANGQLLYAQAAPDKWQALGPVRSMAALDALQPGDLLLANGHVMVFVGPELPLQKWPAGTGELKTCKYSVVHSSRSGKLASSRGPRCDDDCRWVLGDSKMWYAFRAVSMNANSPMKATAEAVFQMGYFDGSGNGGASYAPQS